MTEPLRPRVSSLARRAEREVTEHWEYALLGTVLFLALVVVAFAVTRAIIRRRRRSLLRRTLDYIEELGGHRERIAKRLKELVDENVDSEEIATQINKRVKTIQKELRAVDQAISSFREQGRQLAR